MRRLTMIFDERISFVGDKSTWQSNYFYVTRDLLRMLKIWYDFTSENDIDAMLQHPNQTAYQTLDARSLTIPCTNWFGFFFSLSRTYKKNILQKMTNKFNSNGKKIGILTLIRFVEMLKRKWEKQNEFSFLSKKGKITKRWNEMK